MMPPGYKVACQTKTNTDTMLEMIPDGESLDRWTEMSTVQVMRNVNGYTLSGFYAGMREAWANMFPCGATEIVERGHERLQPTLYWSHACPLNENTGQPEYTWFKALIRGGNVVVVHEAFKFEPSADAVEFWLTFLRELRVPYPQPFLTPSRI
ncbi:MAG: hypothetical protein EPN45_21795 [Rhizobiaceae bacterium]|nr:MAG: hypothetical protein EPN45_21795 [Rhizobiaceae bacterium]